MIVNYHAVDRKALVKEISNITDVKAVYKYMPTCAYEIDYFTITKEGNLICIVLARFHLFTK